MVTIVRLYPEMLGTYGDGGNALVLQSRLQARGLKADVVDVYAGEKVKQGDIYLLGGGEDGPQRFATEELRRSDFAAYVLDGSTVLAVCAGLQIIGTQFAVAESQAYQGLGLVHCATERNARRIVGNILTTSAYGHLAGFENHGGRTTLASSVQPLGNVVTGFGNDGQLDGFQVGSIFATYAHGPVLALNPTLADGILESTLGISLDPYEGLADQLHQERVNLLLAKAGAARTSHRR